MPSASNASSVERPPLASRVLSLSGLVPLGAFLATHLAANARILRGGAAFARGAEAFQRVPLLPLIEVCLVFLPLLAHAAVGVWLMVTGRPLAPGCPYSPALRTAVRVTGLLAALFIVIHLPELRFRAPGARLGGGELETLLSADLSATSHGVPWRGLVYLAGTACVTFHFVVGLWGFVARTPRGRANAALRRGAAWAAAALGGGMWLVFASVVVFYATGARVLGGGAEEEVPQEVCPAPP